MTFPTILKTSLFVLTISTAAACRLQACPDAQNSCGAPAVGSSHTQIIQDAFMSACHTSPDPASVSYYLDQLESGTRTAEQVKASVATSCTASKTADLCQHVSGLNDLCKTASN